MKILSLIILLFVILQGVSFSQGCDNDDIMDEKQALISYSKNIINEFESENTWILHIEDKEVQQLTYKKELIKYLRKKYDFPNFMNNGDFEISRQKFMNDVKTWYSYYPDIYKVLNIRNFNSFKLFDAQCYGSPPVFNSNASKTEMKKYEQAFNNWAAHHPDLPKMLGTDNAAKQKFEEQTKDFMDLYYKKR